MNIRLSQTRHSDMSNIDDSLDSWTFLSNSENNTLTSVSNPNHIPPMLSRSLSLENKPSAIPSSNVDEGPHSFDMCHSMYNYQQNGNSPFNETSAAAIRRNLPDKNNEDKSNLKEKLLSSFNNLRHGFTVKMNTQFSLEEPIIYLGIIYHYKYPILSPQPPHDFRKELVAHNRRAIEAFKEDYRSRIFLTYRSSMFPLPQSNITSDMGWGCMLRVGQMMLAFSLSVYFLKRTWRLKTNSCDIRIYRNIMRMFTDRLEPLGPFSLQKIIEISLTSYGKKAKDWFGPATIACILKDCLRDNNANEEPKTGYKYARHNELSNFCIYIAQNCTIYTDQVDEMAFNAETGDWKNVLVIIPVRLGGEKMNKDYAECLKGILSLDCCTGIIGGKPKHSVWVCGTQGEEFIYFDPHLCQEAVDMNDPLTVTESFHCLEPRKMPFGKLDPSCAICLLFTTKKQLLEVGQNIDKFSITQKPKKCNPNGKMRHPIFSVTNKPVPDRQLSANEPLGKDKHFGDFVLL